jgi:pimeloyl-ACP methyl ester carboxylesterase
MWRTRGVGETAMGATTRTSMRIGSGMSDEWARGVMEHFDHGTQRAILRLYRASDPPVLEAAGAKLGVIGAPALIIWGEDDPYLPIRFGHAVASKLPAATCEIVSGAGHWPWTDDAAVIDRVESFLSGQSPA